MSDVNFGSVVALPSAQVDTTGAFTLSCSGGAPNMSVNICLSLGSGSGGSSGAVRKLVGPGNATVTYGLYVNAARTTSWGSKTDTSLGTIPTIPASGSSNTGSLPLYGRLNSGFDAMVPGTYSASFSGVDAQLYAINNNSTDCTGQTNLAVTPTTLNFTVSVSLVANCTISALPLSFGTAGLLLSVFDAQTTLSARCTNTTPYTISLDNGLTGAGPAARKLTNGSNTITYGLYLDAARANPWGTAAGQTASGTGTGVAQTSIVYGRVPSQGGPAAGNYSDTVVITVSY